MGSCCSRDSTDPPGPPGPEPPPEEETVKEVLSETPAWPISKKDLEAPGNDQRSEASSEICSLTETVSAASTASAAPPAAEPKRREPLPPSPVKHRMKRSFSGELPVKRVDAAGLGCRSGRYSSPQKRREGGVNPTPPGRPRAPPPAARGSVSPAAARRVPPPPMPAPQCRRSMSAPRMNGRASPRRIPCEAGNAEGEGEGEGKESLENPLVSLECFIFL